jgi:hypothetical protein
LLAFLKRLIRAARYAATDSRIPKSLRWFAALGFLPVPGPFDEIVLLLVAVPLGPFYRGPLKDTWTRSGEELGALRQPPSDERNDRG